MANPEKLKEKEILNVEVRDVLVTGSTVKLGRTRTCDLLIRSQDTCVYGCLWLFKYRLSKPTSHSGCSQLFAWVTVASLSTAVASDE